MIQVLPLSLAKRTFGQLGMNKHEPNIKISPEIVINQMEKLASENEQLKKQINNLESRLNQLDVEAARFAEKLTDMKETNPHKDITAENFNALWDELTEMLKKQEETHVLLSKVDGGNLDIGARLEQLTTRWNQVFGDKLDEHPQVLVIKQKLETLKSNVAKKEIEKNRYANLYKSTQQELEEVTLQKARFVKLFKQTQSKISAQEKIHSAALSRKQAIIDSLKNEKTDLSTQINQLKQELELARKSPRMQETPILKSEFSLEMVKGLGLKR